MTINRHHIEVSGMRVEVVRKWIKNMHLRVYPPDGSVRVSVPMRLGEDAIRQVVESRLGWIRRRQEVFEKRGLQVEREMVTGEKVHVQGRRYRLNVIEHNKPAFIKFVDDMTLELRVRPGADTKKREDVLNRWYRQLLSERVPELIAKWEPVIGVDVKEWGIKRMKTRWGTCNIRDRRIWLNLVLAKKPESCLEYVVVHEMVHLLERNHNDMFKAHMSRFMPEWKTLRAELKRFPLQYEKWEC